MKYIICIFILLIPIQLKDSPGSQTALANKESEYVVKLLDEDEIFLIGLEDYIVGVVACEMPASFHNEALKAQAVASRTYALQKMGGKKEYDLKNSTANQCYITIDEMKNKWKASFDLYYEKIVNAVYSTKGEYITYDGEIIKALYFSTSNGYTEDVALVFGGNEDYLESVASPWDINSSTYERQTIFNSKEFLNKLKIDDKEITKIIINDRSANGRVNYITINNAKIKGTKFRTLLGIRSTDFDIEYNKNKVIINTRGYGHGVGMSQYGSNGMASEGSKYKDILKYYYQNVEINSIN